MPAVAGTTREIENKPHFLGRKRMSVKLCHPLAVLVVLAGGIAGMQSARAQDAESSLADQLKTQYKLAKTGSDSNGGSIVETGTVLVIQKGGILGVPLSNVAMAPAMYKDGDLRGPGAGSKMFIGMKSRQLTIGEKVYITKIDVHAKNDKIMLTIVECDSCNGVQQPSSYKSAVVFQFKKDYLGKADGSQIKDVISEVLAPDSAGNDQQAQAQPGQAQQGQAQPVATLQPQAAPATIAVGQTTEQVQMALGQPEKIVNLGTKQIYVYKDLKITFVSGKVSDVQ
jgi:hypothetical protein